jgi:hypothetical protein
MPLYGSFKLGCENKCPKTKGIIRMKKIALTLLAIVLTASISFAKDKGDSSKPKAQKISGWIADEKCAAEKGSSAAHAACAKKCIESGAPAVFVSDKDKKVYKIENQDAAKGHEGHHVKVAGRVTGDSIHVESVSMLKQPKAEKPTGEHKGM